MEQCLAQGVVVLSDKAGRTHQRRMRVNGMQGCRSSSSNGFRVLDDVEGDAVTMSACMLGQVVRARELLATLAAFERLFLCVEGSVVALEVLLATEAATADVAHKGLGRVLSQRLLTTATGGHLCGSRLVL